MMLTWVSVGSGKASMVSSRNANRPQIRQQKGGNQNGGSTEQRGTNQCGEHRLVLHIERVKQEQGAADDDAIADPEDLNELRFDRHAAVRW